MSILQHIGNVLRKILYIGTEVGYVAEPIVDLAFPQVAGIYNSAIGLAMSTEASSSSISGTGAQKLGQLTENLVPGMLEWAKKNGIVWSIADITKWASAVVDTVNLIPAPTVPVAAVAVVAAKLQPTAALPGAAASGF